MKPIITSHLAGWGVGEGGQIGEPVHFIVFDYQSKTRELFHTKKAAMKRCAEIERDCLLCQQERERTTIKL